MFREYITKFTVISQYQSTSFPPESLTASYSPRDLSITSSRTQKDPLISEFCVKTKKKPYNLPTCSAMAAVFLSPTAASGICSGSPTVVRLRTAWWETPRAQSHRGRQEWCNVTKLLWLLTKECKHVKIPVYILLVLLIPLSHLSFFSLVNYCNFFIMHFCLSYRAAWTNAI